MQMVALNADDARIRLSYVVHRLHFGNSQALAATNKFTAARDRTHTSSEYEAASEVDMD